VKTIAKPETVLKRSIHYVEEHISGSNMYNPTEEEGVLRHFKILQWWGGFWANDAEKYVKFNISDPFVVLGRRSIETVIQGVLNVVRYFKLNVTSQKGWNAFL